MLIEVWSDVVCPWCYLGHRRLTAALGRFEHAAEVEVRHRGFELDPGAPRRPDAGVVDKLAARSGRRPEEVRAGMAALDRMAAAEGLPYRLADTVGGNTFDAHRLVRLGRAHGREAETLEALFRAHFLDLQAIGDPEVLAAAAVGAGLPAGEVADTLAGDRFADDVRADEAAARRLGITGVPYFLLDGRRAVPGAQDPDTLLAALRRAWQRSEPAAG